MPLVVDTLELSLSRTELLLAKHNTRTWLYKARRVAIKWLISYLFRSTV